MNEVIIDTIIGSTLSIASKLGEALLDKVLSVTRDTDLAEKQVEKLVQIKLQKKDEALNNVRFGRDNLLNDLSASGKTLTTKIGAPLNTLVSLNPAEREETEDLIVSKVGKLMHFYRYTVFKAIKDSIMIIKESVENTPIETTLNKLKVKYLTIPEFVLELPEPTARFKGFTTRAILGSRYDVDNFNDNFNYLDKISPDVKRDVWRRLAEISNTKDTGLLENESAEPDYIFIAYAMLHSLQQAPIDGSLGSVAEYNKMIVELKDFLHTRVNAIRTSYYDMITSKTLIVRKFENTLILNSDVAGVYFKEHTIEPLLGLLLTKEYKASMDYVISNEERLMDVYNKAKMKDNIVRKNMIEEVYVDAYIKNTDRIIEMLSAGIIEDDKKDVRQRVISYIKGIKDPAKLMNIKDVIEEMTGEYIISITGFKEFVDSISLYQKQSPELTISEASGLTGIDMVLDILFEGIIVQ